MPLVLNLKNCRPMLIFFKTNSDDESIFSLNDVFNILLLYENVHTRMFPLVCDTDGLVSVVYDVRCACVCGRLSTAPTEVFVCLLQVPPQLSRGLRLCQYRNRTTRDPTLSTHSWSQNIVILTREPWSEGPGVNWFHQVYAESLRSLSQQTRTCFGRMLFPRNLWLCK